MSDWVASNVPPWLVLLGLIVLVAGGSMLVLAYVRHQFPGLKEGEQNQAAGMVYRVIGFVYAFFIGFVVSAMWAQINSADAAARIEGSAGVQLAKDLIVFDKADSDRIRQSLLEYVRAAEAEWPVVANGPSSPEAGHALERLRRAYTEVQTHNDAQKSFLATSFANLDKFSQARTQRIIQARTGGGPPWSLWVVIFLTSVMLLGCTIIIGDPKPTTHYPMVAAVGVLVAAQLFLILQLSHPYVGEIATSPEPLHEVIEVLSPPSA